MVRGAAWARLRLPPFPSAARDVSPRYSAGSPKSVEKVARPVEAVDLVQGLADLALDRPLQMVDRAASQTGGSTAL